MAIGEKFFAAMTKSSYISSVGGLIALQSGFRMLNAITSPTMTYPTMPDAQCNVGTVAPQKNHIGALTFVISKFQIGEGPEKLLPRPASPLLNPPGRGIQGSSNDD